MRTFRDRSDDMRRVGSSWEERARLYPCFRQHGDVSVRRHCLVIHPPVDLCTFKTAAFLKFVEKTMTYSVYFVDHVRGVPRHGSDERKTFFGSDVLLLAHRGYHRRNNVPLSYQRGFN